MQELIENIFNEILEKNGIQKLRISKSNRPDLCDFQCNEVFKLAKTLNMAPMDIGNKIVKVVNDYSDFYKYFKEVTFVMPGFINIKVSDYIINECIRKMNVDHYGIAKPEHINTYILDYGGYNIAKPLHIGHLRPSIIGEAIKRIVMYKGHKVIADVHLGDFGLQMGQVIYGILKDNKDIEDIDIDYLNKIYPEISGLCKENEEVKKECEKITKELQNGNEEYTNIWNKIYQVSLDDVKELCNYLDIHFDLWQGEYDANKYLDDVEALLNDKNLLVKSEGALVVPVKQDEDNKPMPPMMFKKSNGGYVYDSTDLATIYERKTKYNPDYILYVTDFRQNLHFEQVFRVSELLGLVPYNRLIHAYNGTINGTDGKPFKTRKGDAPKLRELFDMVKETFVSLKESNKDMSDVDLDKITNAIIKFADLSNSRDKDYIFDIEKFSGVVGKTGPYILYTYLRINKVIKDNMYKELGDTIYNDTDRNLRMKILELQSSFEASLKEYKPHYIAEYIYNLCVEANNFYENNHINGCDDQAKLNDWVYILDLTNRIIKDMLSLLMIEIPSKM
ncbi:MAG: arginine--tRNA ligase [Bacilli bacterium]|nr:arginine--tRNA ligase [Bacilli bacterium]